MQLFICFECAFTCGFLEWQIEESLQQVHAFVLELQELKVTELRRGPHLAILEIEKQRLLLAPDEISTETPSVCLAESILKYFQR